MGETSIGFSIGLSGGLDAELTGERTASIADSCLLAGLQAGAENAYEALITRFQQPVFNLVIRLLNDAGGYLFQPEADQARGRAARQDRSVAGPLQQAFDELWDRSERASVLQTLNI